MDTGRKLHSQPAPYRYINALLTARLDRPVQVINDADAAGLAEARYGAGAGVEGTVLVVTLGTGIGSAFIFDGKLVPNVELGHLDIDGHDAESKASAVARERDSLSWDEYSVLLQRYFSHVEFLFSPDLLIVGGGISQRAHEYLPNLNLRTPIVPAALKNEAGIVGAATEIAMKHNCEVTDGSANTGGRELVVSVNSIDSPPLRMVQDQVQDQACGVIHGQMQPS